MKLRPFAHELSVFLAFTGLTVLMTWPWAANLRDGVGDTGDSYLNAWILWWDYHQTFTDPLKLFHANILYPYRYTLAFSEHNYGIALFFFPLYALGFRPLTVHGVATLVGFAFCGYGAYRLARTLTNSTGAGFVAGAIFAFLPYRFHHLPHVTYLFSGWIPLTLEALVLYVRRPTRRRAAWLGATYFMNALTCIHWFVLTLIPLSLTGLFLIRRYGRWCERAFWMRVAVALGASGLALLPFFLPYLRVAKLYGLVRGREEAEFFSATPAHWLMVDWQNRLWDGLGRSLTPYQTELALFPGLLPVLLALCALLLGVWARRAGTSSEVVRDGDGEGVNGDDCGTESMRSEVEEREVGGRGKWHMSEVTAVGLIWLVIGFLGSFGMNTFFHRLLFEYVPIFRSIRVPARWAMICFVGLSLLAGLGACRLVTRLAANRPRAIAGMAFAVILLLGLFEHRAAPLRLIRGEVDPDPVTLWLARTQMRGGIVELPSGVGHSNYLYVLRAADHARPLVNGVSGFRPPIVGAIEEMSRGPRPSDHLLDLLEAIPVSYLVVHHAALDEGSREGMRAFLAHALAAGRLRLVGRFGDSEFGDELFAITKTEPVGGSSGER